MTAQKERRPTWRGGNRRVGEHRRNKHTRFVPPVQGPVTPIDVGADALLARCIEGERRVVASGWLDPVGLHDAGHVHNLAGGDFTDRECGFLYAYLVTCADNARTPDVDEACTLGRKHGVDIDDVVPGCELLDLLIAYWPIAGPDLDDLVGAVTHWNRRRLRAQRHWRIWARLTYTGPILSGASIHRNRGHQLKGRIVA